jgi:hypothetical protein
MEKMKQTIVPMKADAKLVIRSTADLFIEGVAQTQLVATVDDGDSFRMKDEGGTIYLHANSDTKLTLPESVSLVVERVGGDASILGMKGKVEVQKIGGDLHFQTLDTISVDTVGGDCVFKDVTGSVEIKRVGGDLDGFKVMDLSAYFVGGDAELSGVQGLVQIATGGDVHLQLNTQQIKETHVRAGGDIALVVMENSLANLDLDSGSEEISVRACGQHLDVEEGSYHLPLGEGGAIVQLRAGGDIVVREGKESMNEFSFVFENLGDTWRDFGREIEDKVKRSMRGVNHSLRHASWEASNAMRGAAEKFDQFTRDTPKGDDGKVYGFGFETDNDPAGKEKRAASDEERMLVLKMLQDKKITVEEAEKLLQALEG